MDPMKREAANKRTLARIRSERRIEPNPTNLSYSRLFAFIFCFLILHIRCLISANMSAAAINYLSPCFQRSG